MLQYLTHSQLAPGGSIDEERLSENSIIRVPFEFKNRDTQDLILPPSMQDLV